MWASALSVIPVIPVWAAALVFVCGLMLIPLRAVTQRVRS
jgi:hypothetical protein